MALPGIFGRAETAVFGSPSAGIGVAQSPGFPGANLTTSAAPSPDIGFSIFDAPGQIPGAIPGTDPSGIGELGQFGPGLTPLPSLTPDFSTFDTSKFAFGGFGVDTPGGKFTFDQKTGFNFESGLGGLRSDRTQLAFVEADRLDQVAEDLNLGLLTKARLAEFDRREQALDLAESETIGGLRDQLGSRRVLGASFANAQIRREREGFRQTRNDLANRRALVAGESKLQEFQLRQQALTKASQARIQAIQLNITETFGETELAVQYATQMSSILEASLRARLIVEFQDLAQQRQLAVDREAIAAGVRTSGEDREARSSAGFGQLIGALLGAPIAGPVGAAGGSVFGKIFEKIF